MPRGPVDPWHRLRLLDITTRHRSRGCCLAPLKRRRRLGCLARPGWSAPRVADSTDPGAGRSTGAGGVDVAHPACAWCQKRAATSPELPGPVTVPGRWPSGWGWGGSVAAGVGPFSSATLSPFPMLRGQDGGEVAHLAAFLLVTVAGDHSSPVRSQMAVGLPKTTILAAVRTRSPPVSGLTGINHPVPGPWLIGAHDTS